MIYAIHKENILRQLLIQLESHFILSENEKDGVAKYFDTALNSCESNFRAVNNKYYVVADKKGELDAFFNPYHSVQYMIFLYYLSHDIYARGHCEQLAEKIYYLNKILHSVDLFYAIELPEKFCAEHPLGSVMGRAKYSDGFFFYQGCTVGGTIDSMGNIAYPIIGEDVHMFANSSILGKCKIGNNVNIGAGAIVKNQDIPDNVTVFGESPNLIIKVR